MRPVLRVMLVDDHGFVRSAIRQALTAPDIEIVGEAPSAEEALRIAPELRPDVVLIDIDLPGMNGLRLLRELRPRLPDCKFVMLTVSTSQADVLEAVRLGAVGKTLIVDVKPDEGFALSARNLPRVAVVPSARITARDVADTAHVIVTRAALETLQDSLS